ncbi:two-component system CitB family sensor kinase [Deinococcus metalli]|uniref:histidine kinase n=1 Tax=Deinococcus metalli TaxID=1141878 RepID=A0A7W8NMW2_9DEIO|nr:sensor histidine kinase [Deinococcus metalli]MBB5375111.1 two-component system CitB family sensor kinase [Deinococcus metalli]GHF31521.1 histidine kinase [Deinococcus metalli]
MTAFRLPRSGLQGRLVRWHLLVLCGMTALLLGVQTLHLYGEARDRLGERAMTTSRIVATLPEVVRAAEAGNQDAALNAEVNAMRVQAEADFIVVGDRRGIRLVHPLQDRLGKPMEGGDNDEPLSGREVISVARGSLGVSVRGKVPIWTGAQPGTQVVGVVSTGYLMPQAWHLVGEALVSLLPWILLALGLGTLGAVWAARRLRAEILNLEPEEIAALARQQRAVLAALREGVIAVDRGGQITLASARAADMLLVPSTPVPLARVWPELADLSPGHARQQNLELQLRGQPYLVNVEPLDGGGLDGGGFIVGFRNRAEVLALADELTHARGFVDVLRAQTHEYQNRLHVLSGLLQLGRHEEALRVLNAEIRADAEFRQLLRDVQVPRLVALLAGKRERAQELGIDFQVAEGSMLSPVWERHADTLVTAVGNLTENAFEALAGQPGVVTVLIGEDPDGVQVEVEDTGPGVAPNVQERLYTRGASSKGEGRGYGLAGVQARVQALGGQLRYVRRSGRTVFQVSLPPPTSRAPGAAPLEVGA